MSYDTNLRAAVSEHVKAKGRHHSMLTYQALVAAFNAPKIMPEMREAFEAWSLPRRDEQATRNAEYPDQYEDITMQIEWQAWKASTSSPSVLPIPSSDPRYDARCALQDRTDWSAA